MRFFDFNWFGLIFSAALPAGVIIGMASALIRAKIRARRGGTK